MHNFRIYFSYNSSIVCNNIEISNLENDGPEIYEYVSTRCHPRSVDRHRGKRMEHYKSGIRVSHGTVRPAAGIKMTSEQAHVLSWMAGGIEQRDRHRAGERSSRTGFYRSAALHHHSDDPLWKFLQFHCNRDISLRTWDGRVCVCAHQNVAMMHMEFGDAWSRRAFILRDRIDALYRARKTETARGGRGRRMEKERKREKKARDNLWLGSLGLDRTLPQKRDTMRDWHRAAVKIGKRLKTRATYQRAPRSRYS